MDDGIVFPQNQRQSTHILLELIREFSRGENTYKTTHTNQFDNIVHVRGAVVFTMEIKMLNK